MAGVALAGSVRGEEMERRSSVVFKTILTPLAFIRKKATSEWHAARCSVAGRANTAFFCERYVNVNGRIIMLRFGRSVSVAKRDQKISQST